MAGAWPSPLSSAPPNTTAAMHDQLRKFLASHDPGPYAALAADLRKHFETQVRFAAREESPAAELQRIFSNPLVAQTWMIELKDGDAYYALRKPELTGQEYKFNALDSVDRKESPTTRKASEVLRIRFAPQAVLARRVKPKLSDASRSLASWDAAVLDVLQSILEEPGIDPLLRAALLTATIRAGVSGSVPLERALKAPIQLLETTQLDLNVSWVDPWDLKALEERRRAVDLFGRFPALKEFRAVEASVRQQLDEGAGRIYAPVGLLVRDRDGAWTCRISTHVAPGSELVVLIASPQKAWRSIGKWTPKGNGVLSVDPRFHRDFLEGRLVFVDCRANPL